MTPEDSALAFYDGLVDRYQDEHVTLREALPALAALILAERLHAALEERERCANIAESFIPSGFTSEGRAGNSYAVARDDRARTIAAAIRADQDLPR